jgi:very-short-patch-repair endonuclease
MNKTEEFIKRARLKHGETYDYSKVEYTKAIEKVIVICRKHGDFLQTPSDHLQKKGCNQCGINSTAEKLKGNTEIFIKKAVAIHGNTYDYSKVNYMKDKEKVIVICRKHGDFLQTPSDHLQQRGCNQCGINSTTEKRRSNTDDFIKKAVTIHGDTYDYSKVEYINSNSNVTIVCKLHGEFQQIASNHCYNGFGCYHCGINSTAEKRRSTTKDFIKKAVAIHGDTYDYSKVEYISSKNQIIIVCKKHGDFLQTIGAHLSRCGCPFCTNKTEGKLFEKIKYIYPTITTQFNQEWCKNKRFDFCIPEHNIIIELDGAQHFRQIRNWQSPEEQFENDKFKEQCANDNNYSVIRLLQEDVWTDKYDWCKELCDTIEEIKQGDNIVNIYLCKNNEYDGF